MATQIFGRLFPKTLTSLTSFRSLSTRATILSLIERLNHSPNSSALKLRNGYDYYRNAVVMQKQKHDIGPFSGSRGEIIHDYVKSLANLVGSEEEARMMVYSGDIGPDYNIFGTLLSKELYDRVEVLPGVSEINGDDRFENIDEMLLLWPLDVMEKSVRQALAREEEFSRLLLTKQGIYAACEASCVRGKDDRIRKILG